MKRVKLVPAEPQDSHRQRLNAMILADLKDQGVSESIVAGLRGELEAKTAQDNQCTEVCQTHLMRIFNYAATGAFEVSVSTIDGTSCRIGVHAWTTISDTKALIDEHMGIRRAKQKLIPANGHSSLDENAKSLSACQINPLQPTLQVVQVAHSERDLRVNYESAGRQVMAKMIEQWEAHVADNGYGFRDSSDEDDDEDDEDNEEKEAEDESQHDASQAEESDCNPEDHEDLDSNANPGDRQRLAAQGNNNLFEGLD